MGAGAATGAKGTGTGARGTGLGRRQALRFILLLGLVSLFADMTYEGARSITGPYLALFGATGTVVGIVAGLGELTGYAMRLLSGWIADRTGRYWAVTLLGYLVNLLAVPLLALAWGWPSAAALIVAERMGRAIRSPARDAMLSHAATHTGLGWGFGLHEALDQIGAVAGPLLVALLLAWGQGYRASFAWLALPAAAALLVLLAARRAFPRPRDFDLAPPPLAAAGLPQSFRLYLGAVALVAAGFLDFSLLASHFERAGTVAPAVIPVLYAIAMAADALAALALGRLFDHKGLLALVLATALTAPAAPLALLGGPLAAGIALVLWGVGMGAQESVLRAAVARMVPAERRATAYGLMNAVYGVAWFAGSALLGVLYDRSPPAVAFASAFLQLAAVPLLLVLAAGRATPPAGAHGGRDAAQGDRR